MPLSSVAASLRDARVSAWLHESCHSIPVPRRPQGDGYSRNLPPMFGLVIVHDETGVDDAGEPAEQRQQDTQEEAEDAASHQDRHGRKDDAKKVAQGFHKTVRSPTLRVKCQL